MLTQDDESKSYQAKFHFLLKRETQKYKVYLSDTWHYEILFQVSRYWSDILLIYIHMAVVVILMTLPYAVTLFLLEI